MGHFARAGRRVETEPSWQGWVMKPASSEELSDIEWLEAFVGEWHLLADLSFSDLLLWLPDADGEVFTCVAQVRPVTGPTALEDDVIGEVVEHEPDHQVIVAYLTKEIASTSDNELNAGIPVTTDAVPVIRGGRCIAIMERHTNQMGVRVTGLVEENYLQIAEMLIEMLLEGKYPLPQPSDKALAPKVGDGVLRVQTNGLIAYASPNAVTAFRRLGAQGDILQENFEELVRTLRSGVEEIGQTIQADLAAQRSVTLDLEHNRSWMRLVIFPLEIRGKSTGKLVLCRDTTDLLKRDRMLVTKDATIREIHHRVKNNLQTVAALLRMQSRRLASQEGKDALRDANRRVASIAVVHDALSRTMDGDVAFDGVADEILGMVGDIAAAAGEVTASRIGSFGVIPAACATSLAMVLTELCQNAIEHGLNNSSGTVEVRPERDRDQLTVEVSDDGVGLPEGFRLGDQTSLGLSIVSTLISDLHGSLSITRREQHRGTTARVVLPLREF